MSAPGPAEILEQAWYRNAWWLTLLLPLAWLYRAVVALRRTLYRSGLLPVYRPPVPVVVVGNITVGGTGKTPVVIALVQALQQRGIAVGVVARGYGGSSPTPVLWVTDDTDPGQCGDEPLLIRRRTACPCVVSRSRVAAVQTLLARGPLDLVISDDGLQHYALERDLEIAVLDVGRATGNGRCLPAGPLREPVTRLRGVDFLLYRGSDDLQSGLSYRARDLVNLASGERREARPRVPGETVHGVAGIGQPRQFFTSLRQLGFQVTPHVFPDHHRYRREDFADLAGRPIIMTAKDAVKCTHLAGTDAWYLEIDACLPQAVISAVAALARP